MLSASANQLSLIIIIESTLIINHYICKNALIYKQNYLIKDILKHNEKVDHLRTKLLFKELYRR